MKQVYWRAPTWKYNFRNTQRYSPLPSIHYVIDENLSVVAVECLTVLGNINEQVELNIAKENCGIKKRSWDVQKCAIWQKCHRFMLNRRSIYFALNFIIFSNLALIFATNIPYISFRNRDIKKHGSVIFL